MKIGVVGAGISGIYAAHHLAPQHDVTLYEANCYLGGHTDTHHVTIDDGVFTVDTGFIVFNRSNYPLFSAFIDELEVTCQPSDMSFSVCDRNSGLEYNATNFAGLIARRSNLVRPGFYRMLIDIIRFNRHSPRLLECGNDELTIGDYLVEGGYGRDFVNNHIIPMASALWSSPPSTVNRFPARYFVSFLNNHGMLQIADRPLWRTVTGGSSQYVKAFEQRFEGQLRIDARVERVERKANDVLVHTARDTAAYDAVILSCHSDQALNLLGNGNDREKDLLGAIAYQSNAITLHTDASAMPDNPNAWASWNVVKPDDGDEDYIVTYYMNKLQNIDTPIPLLVSLNADDRIDKNQVLLRRNYHHPVYTPESLRAQRELSECNGRGKIYFAGAYMGWGFHEDGARSAQQVVDAIAARAFSHAA